MELGCRGGAAGEDESLERFDLFVECVDPMLEGGDVLIGDAGADGLVAFDALFDVGGGEFAADVEQVRLYDGEPTSEVVVGECGAGDAESGVQFVDGTVSLDTDVVFGDALSAEEAGFAIVASSGVDLRVAQEEAPTGWTSAMSAIRSSASGWRVATVMPVTPESAQAR